MISGLKTILTALAGAGLLAGCASAPAPVMVLNAQQANQLPGYTEVSLASAGFRTAALVNAEADIPQTQTELGVDRHTGVVSAAYAGVSNKTYAISPPPGPATGAAPASGSIYAFKQSGDAGQAWATMTAAGMPFISLQALGQSAASGTASWRGWVTPTPGHENVYVQFALPAVQLTGATEQNGPSPYQARMRADLSVNGHPFWSTEANRISQLDPSGQGGGGDNCGNGFEGSNRLMAFGAPIGFSDNPAQLSSPRIVTLWLGAFSAGQAVEVGLIVRADTQVARRCCPTNVMTGKPEFFCTRATADLTWDNTAQPVRFWIGPAVS